MHAFYCISIVFSVFKIYVRKYPVMWGRGLKHCENHFFGLLIELVAFHSLELATAYKVE